MKTVFFGPFIGEFGWELLFWQGWVRKLCKGEFSDYRKIAVSFPGRQPFYPYVDELWSLPKEFIALKASGHGYYTDGWRGGYPGKPVYTDQPRKFLGILDGILKPKRTWKEERMSHLDIEPAAKKMLVDFKKKLPIDTTYFIPWKNNFYKPDNLVFGVNLPEGQIPTLGSLRPWKRIEFEHQLLEHLTPSSAGLDTLRSQGLGSTRFILIFPRFRVTRRADKNWSKEKYQDIIQQLQVAYPDCKVGVCGEPGGAYFVDGVPEGCVDFINVDPLIRMDIQVAAMKQSVLALGSMSGAVLVTAAAGTPTLTWGYPQNQARYYIENFMKTDMEYYPEIDPEVKTIFKHAEKLIKRRTVLA